MPASQSDAFTAPSPFKPLLPSLAGFEEMFVEHLKSAGSVGLPFGSTLLLSGPPGAGKTTFALSLVRSLMMPSVEVQKQDTYKLKRTIVYFISSEINLSRLRKMYYPMGWFAPEDQEGFPIVDGTTKYLFRIDKKGPDEDNFYVVVPEPAVDRPVPTPEELVNDVFNRIAKSLSPSESEIEDCDVIVVVDSITAILKGCAANDERRHTHEILHRLRVIFGQRHLALTVLLAEQDHPERSLGQGSTVEDYLADIVFRLSHKPLAMGRRSRVLEVVKSQGVNIISGEHSWAIITDRTCGEWLRHPEYAKMVQRLAQPPGEIHWGTVAIFTRPRLLLRQPDQSNTLDSVYQQKQEEWKQPRNHLHTGTDGLDEMLNSDPDYWLRDTGSVHEASAESKKRLLPGSTTLLAGPVGSGKTSICMQFLLRDAWEFNEGYHAYQQRTVKGPHSGEGYENMRNLFVCLGSDAHRSIKEAWAAQFPEAAVLEEKSVATYDKWVAVLDFTQSHFDFNHLMAHLKWALNEFRPPRIAFDGLSEWLTMFERADAAKMLEAIGVVIDHHPVFEKGSLPRPTVFMAYELASANEPFTAQNVTVAAENIVTIRQINIQDEIRRIVFVLKSTGLPDRNVRELSMQKDKRVLRVRDTLDTFNGLLRNHAEPAEVLLKLFRENNPQRTFNQWLIHRLSRLSNLRFKALDFPRSEIGRTLGNTASPTRFPPADLKIISLDEWWLRAQPTRAETPMMNLEPIWSLTPPEARATGDVPTKETTDLSATWQEFWVCELEKARGEAKTGLYAVPASLDYGLFCVNLRMICEAPVGPLASLFKATDNLKPEEVQRLEDYYGGARRRDTGDDNLRKTRKNEIAAVAAAWKNLVGNTPRYWVEFRGEEFDLCPASHTASIFGLLTSPEVRAALAGDGHAKWGFSFDMATQENCVCVFLELAWAFGAPEDFLASRTDVADAETSCLRAIQFLQLLVLEGLMPARGTVATTRRSLFSHHFYSTLQSVADLDRWDSLGGKDEEIGKQESRAWRVAGPAPAPGPPRYSPPSLVAMPLFPAGAPAGLDAAASGHLLDDIEQRLRTLCRHFQNSKFHIADGIDIEQDRGGSSEARWETYHEIVGRLVRRLHEEPSTADSLASRNAAGILQPTYDDLLELCEQVILCLRLCDAGGRSLSEVLRQPVPLKMPDGTKMPPAAAHASGYSCTGSWLYGVDKNTRSPSLARSLLQEITSLEVAEERARRGAGIPARRDFFDLHGDEAVPGMEYLTWRELLRNCGARSRRRSIGINETGKTFTRIHQLIQDQVLWCLQVAQLHAEEYQNIRRNEPVATRAAALGKKLKMTHFSAQNMLDKIKELLSERPGGNPSTR